jgi:Tfp pilus assembly protein PilF
MPKSKGTRRRRQASGAAALVKRAEAAERQGDLAAALRAIQDALKAEPNTASHYLHCARLTAAMGDAAAAAQILRRGVDLCPESAELPAQLGVMFAHGGRADLAPDAFALALSRGDIDWIRRQAAFYLTQLSRFEAADAVLAPLLQKQPEDAESLFVRALLRFAEGRYPEAWADYERRWDVAGFFSPKKETAKPVWRGEKAERLLVWREQGIGDEIQFLRFLNDLAGKAETVLYEGDPRLAGLLKRSFPGIDIRAIENGELLPNAVGDAEFDVQVPLGGIAHVQGGKGFGTAAPYLTANAEAVATLKQQFKTTFGTDKLIGLAWFSKNVEHGHGRTIPLEALLPVFKRPGYAFVSVQYGDVTEALNGFNAEHGTAVRNFTGVDLFNQIDRSCSVLAALDGLITIDNTTAHLSGALGVPTALLLPQAVDWRWQCPTEKGNGCLYASHRLFRQSQQGDWGEPVAALEKEMDALFQRA